MKKTWFLPAAAALLLVGCAQNEPKDAQEVIGQYEAATGLSGVTKDTPLMLKLRMNMSDSTKMYCTFIVNPPQERLRLEMSVNGQTAIFAVDGQQGWMLPPDGSGVQVLPKEQIEAFSQQFNALSGIKWDTTGRSTMSWKPLPSRTPSDRYTRRFSSTGKRGWRTSRNTN